VAMAPICYRFRSHQHIASEADYPDSYGNPWNVSDVAAERPPAHP
jgi:hypothetical protein